MTEQNSTVNNSSFMEPMWILPVSQKLFLPMQADQNSWKNWNIALEVFLKKLLLYNHVHEAHEGADNIALGPNKIISAVN